MQKLSLQDFLKDNDAINIIENYLQNNDNCKNTYPQKQPPATGNAYLDFINQHNNYINKNKNHLK